MVFQAREPNGRIGHSKVLTEQVVKNCVGLN